MVWLGWFAGSGFVVLNSPVTPDGIIGGITISSAIYLLLIHKVSQRRLSALCCIPICLPPTLPSALIKENLPTPYVKFSFTLSPKSLKPIQGGDFFVTILLLFPLGYCHRNPVFDKHWVHLKISPCQLGLNANVCEILASMRVTFQPLFKKLFKRPSRGETRKTSLSS